MGESAGYPAATGAALKEILERVRDGLPFEAALSVGIDQLTEPDRHLAHELAAGVLRQLIHFDAQLARLVNRGSTHVAAELQDILRFGAYQITTLDRIPPHAAVDTSVEFAEQSGGARAAGFVNTVLRRLGRAGPEVLRIPPGPVERLASEYPHPAVAGPKMYDAFGQEPSRGATPMEQFGTPEHVAQPARQSLIDQSGHLGRRGPEIRTRLRATQACIVDRTNPAELPGY